MAGLFALLQIDTPKYKHPTRFTPVQSWSETVFSNQIDRDGVNLPGSAGGRAIRRGGISGARRGRR